MGLVIYFNFDRLQQKKENIQEVFGRKVFVCLHSCKVNVHSPKEHAIADPTIPPPEIITS